MDLPAPLSPTSAITSPPRTSRSTSLGVYSTEPKDFVIPRSSTAGCSLGILSNVDDDLLAETRKHFAVAFDLIITAQQVRSYKPAPAHFFAARERIGGARWLHAAQSNFHDVVPCNTLGIPTAWINRKGEAALPGGTPVHEFADVAGLAAFVRSAS